MDEKQEVINELMDFYSNMEEEEVLLSIIENFLQVLSIKELNQRIINEME